MKPIVPRSRGGKTGDQLGELRVNRRSQLLLCDHLVRCSLVGGLRELLEAPTPVAGNVSTPTMLLTGEEDYRTPIVRPSSTTKLCHRSIDTLMVRILARHTRRGRLTSSQGQQHLGVV